MKQGAIQILRLTLLALIFQLVSPLFVSVVSRNDDFSTRSTKTSIHGENHSVETPVLLKEKDETDSDNDFNVADFVALIDFSKLPSVLSEFHNTKITPFVFREQYDYRPPLFTLHRVFLI